MMIASLIRGWAYFNMVAITVSAGACSFAWLGESLSARSCDPIVLTPASTDDSEFPMRYMMLIYSRESEEPMPREEDRQIREGHRVVMEEAARLGILHAAEPLAPTALATTVRNENGKVTITDGPFAETKEQLAGYYILDCKDLDEALEWASRIPTGCAGRTGCVEVRPFRTDSPVPAGVSAQAKT
jgi:hypothetical protein